MSSTLTVQNIIDPLRTYAEFRPLADIGGFETEPALSIANAVMQRMLSQAMNWKWNRAIVPTFLTVSLQQDYPTNVTDMGWLEQGVRIDINNTSTPKPIFTMETVRDLAQTSYQTNTFNLSWVPNSLAILGKWTASTAYGAGYGRATTPATPIQSFRDVNGNLLFINSNSLGLSINSPGYSGTPISTIPPFGTSGLAQPSLPAASAAGATVVDGTVTWTVADPDGYAIRVAPIPSFSGLCWLISALYQKKPPMLTSLGQTLDPVPDEFSYLFRQGLMAMLYQHSVEPAAARKAGPAYQQWEEDLMIALRGADREREDASLYPSEGLMGGGPYTLPFPIGPAYPFSPYGW